MSLVLMQSMDLANGYTGEKLLAAPNAGNDSAATGGRNAWRVQNSDLEWLLPGVTTVVAGFRIYKQYVNSNRRTAALAESDAEHVTVWCNADGSVSCYAGGVLRGTSDVGLVPEDTWCFVEVKAVIDDAAGSVEVRVNGVSVISASGIDTRNGGTTGQVTRLRMGYSQYNYYNHYCDVYALDGTDATATQGRAFNDFLGPVQIRAVVPSGAGDLTQWTPSAGVNYAAVDETDVDDDTTYVEAAADAERDCYAMGDLPASGAVLAVKAVALAKYTVSPLNVSTFLRRGGVNDDGAAAGPSGSYQRLSESIWGKDPFADDVWSEANFNATQAGVLASTP